MYVYDLNRAERSWSFNTKSYIPFMKIKKKNKKTKKPMYKRKRSLVRAISLQTAAIAELDS